MRPNDTRAPRPTTDRPHSRRRHIERLYHPAVTIDQPALTSTPRHLRRRQLARHERQRNRSPLTVGEPAFSSSSHGPHRHRAIGGTPSATRRTSRLAESDPTETPTTPRRTRRTQSQPGMRGEEHRDTANDEHGDRPVQACVRGTARRRGVCTRRCRPLASRFHAASRASRSRMGTGIAGRPLTTAASADRPLWAEGCPTPCAERLIRRSLGVPCDVHLPCVRAYDSAGAGRVYDGGVVGRPRPG